MKTDAPCHLGPQRGQMGAASCPNRPRGVRGWAVCALPQPIFLGLLQRLHRSGTVAGMGPQTPSELRDSGLSFLFFSRLFAPADSGPVQAACVGWRAQGAARARARTSCSSGSSPCSDIALARASRSSSREAANARCATTASKLDHRTTLAERSGPQSCGDVGGTALCEQSEPVCSLSPKAATDFNPNDHQAAAAGALKLRVRLAAFASGSAIDSPAWMHVCSRVGVTKRPSEAVVGIAAASQLCSMRFCHGRDLSNISNIHGLQVITANDRLAIRMATCFSDITALNHRIHVPW